MTLFIILFVTGLFSVQVSVAIFYKSKSILYNYVFFLNDTCFKLSYHHYSIIVVLLLSLLLLVLLLLLLLVVVVVVQDIIKPRRTYLEKQKDKRQNLFSNSYIPTRYILYHG